MTIPSAPDLGERVDRTVAFADLSGFTALTEVHGDEAAHSLVARFVDEVEAVLDDGERLVKSIGDAVMLEAPDPGAGLRLIERVCTALAEAPGFPELRGGLHHGPVLHRGGDLFGATVNLAARVASRAAGGQVLATQVMAVAAEAAGASARSLGLVTLRNLVDPVEVFNIVFGSPEVVAVDPVCRMRVQLPVGQLWFAGRQWSFCSLDCAAGFAQRPEAYG